MNFTNWAVDRDLLEMYTEIFDKGTFLNQEPENGRWEPELGQSNSGYYKFYYSLPSDPKKTCGWNEPCYQVTMDNGSISFSHAETNYSDRWQHNKKIAGDNNDIARSISAEQINSILYAIGKYVEAEKPESLAWSPIRKSDRNSQNPEARRKVYFMWAAKNLFPEYIPLSDSHWSRADKFQEDYEGIEGMPSMEEIVKMGAKKFLQIANDLQEKRRQKEEELAQQREAEENERRRQELERNINDPTLNPNRIAVGDLVYLKSPERPTRHGKLYKVELFNIDRYGDYGNRGDLIAYLRSQHEDGDENPHDQSNDDFWFTANKLYKADEENRSTRNQMVQARDTARRQADEARMQALNHLISNPEVNPNGIKLGDLVYISDPDGTRHGMYGKVVNIQMDGWQDYSPRPANAEPDVYGLYATIKPQRDEDHDMGYTSNRDVSITKLVKATPENQRVRRYNVQRSNLYGEPQKPPTDWSTPAPRQNDVIPAEGLPSPPPVTNHVW